MLCISAAGLVTMSSLAGENVFLYRQLTWLAISLFVFFVLSQFDYRFLRRTSVVISLYGVIIALLLLVLIVGEVTQGAQSWFSFGGFSLQPSEFAKPVLIAVLAKYFSRRHIEIAQFKHIVISGLYALVIAGLVFVQPDFGSTIILLSIWFGMVLVSGLSGRHFVALVLAAIIAFAGLWAFAFTPEQQSRVTSFLDPYADVQGSGYHAYQSTVAVGSGQLLGKGIGFGTQSRLQFLPESETDFIFAAFAEEWGFVGVLLLLGLYGIMLWRICSIAMRGETNFEVLFGMGIAIYFLAHIVTHIGMNVGLLPVTGTTTPFMSYGGSHLLAEFAALGVLMGMRSYGRAIPKEDARNVVASVAVE